MQREISGNSRLLRKLVADVVQGAVPVDWFCQHFEIVFNNESSAEDFTAHERAIFDELFKTVSWYSPFPDERKEIPNYVDEKAVLAAAQHAARGLGLQ